MGSHLVDTYAWQKLSGKKHAIAAKTQNPLKFVLVNMMVKCRNVGAASLPHVLSSAYVATPPFWANSPEILLNRNFHQL